MGVGFFALFDADLVVLETLVVDEQLVAKIKYHSMSIKDRHTRNGAAICVPSGQRIFIYSLSKWDRSAISFHLVNFLLSSAMDIPSQVVS